MIINGQLASSVGVHRASVRIEDGIITEVGPDIGTPDVTYPDDCLVYPGFVDVHVHAREDVTRKECHKEDFTTAANAAIAGGVVHFCDMPNNCIPPVDAESYADKEALVRNANLPCAITLYMGIGPGTKPVDRKVPYKAYMGPSIGELFFESLAQLEETIASYSGKEISFHCEDPELMNAHSSAPTHETKRPPICEINAVRFAIGIAAKYKFAAKLCHISTAGSIPWIHAAKAKGLPITGEATPHHLAFCTEMLSPENRNWMQMNPPLRSRVDSETVREALRDGILDFLATDHSPHTPAEKMRGISGQPHLDTYGQFVTWLIKEQKFSPSRIAEICCEKPGEFVNAYSDRKFGFLAPGYQGSLTVLNMEKPTVASEMELRSKAGWSNFAKQGYVFPGSVEAVYVRGEKLIG